MPELTKADKKKNDETMKLAEAIKAKRTVELVNGEYGFKKEYKTGTVLRVLLRNVQETFQQH